MLQACVFLTVGLCGGLLPTDYLHTRLLIVPDLTANFRPSLITLELIIGFAILVVLPSILMGVFRFLHVSLVLLSILNKSVIFSTSLNIFPSAINVLIKVRCSSEQCLERPIFVRFSERKAFTTCAGVIFK
ncbi:hypothetical protein ILYODFUR_035137 [Ilyodon furcidens]|uniref:Uncharacterized protein n=1 Tax=Ilyodon furcidens TaxID=33524 RepID=A0ABV0THM4_9TELE